MVNKKRVIFISIIAISIAIIGLYSTYAINVSVEATPTNYDMAFNFDLSTDEERQITVAPGKTKLLDINITNPYNDAIQYGVAYSMISPTTLAENVIIAESSMSKNRATGTLEANETKAISLVVVNNSEESITIFFSVINGYKNGGELIVGSEKLIDDVYDIVPPPSLITLMNLGLDDDIQTNTPNFANTSCSSGCDERTVGIYSMKDDLGTSYYFRGDVTNNYVYFGNVYWRIIRINGDGTVRMIYDGTTKHANGEDTGPEVGDESNDKWVSVSQFGMPPIDNTYVGYMQGSAGATTYADTHSNSNNGPIKTYLENTWYQTISANDKTYIADAIYCNDRSPDTSNASYTGIGATETYYAAYQRLVRLSVPAPDLKCKNPNDRFTLEDSNFSIETNGKLNAPVGLITADEVSLAGAHYSTPNNGFYLYDGARGYWTMTPTSYASLANVFYVSNNETESLSSAAVPGGYGVRPVISLKADALKYSATSNGSFEYPFTVTG